MAGRSRKNERLGALMKAHREALSIGQRDLAARLGVTQRTIGNWEAGTWPPPALFEKIAAALQMDLHEFNPTVPKGTHIVDEGPLDALEGMLISKFRRLSTKDRQRVYLFVDSLERATRIQRGEPLEDKAIEAKAAAPTDDRKITPIERARKIADQFEENEETTRVRLLLDVAAGRPLEADRGPDEMDVSSHLVREDPEHMGIVRARGDSMKEAGITDGTLLLCRATMGGFRYSRGDIVVALVGDVESASAMTVKTFAGTHRGTVTLLPENPEFEPIREPAERVRVQGVVRYRLSGNVWIEMGRQPIRGRV